jgi:hypothetical protein
MQSWVDDAWGDVVSSSPNHAMAMATNQPEAHKTPSGLGSATSKSPFACLYGLHANWPSMTAWLHLSPKFTRGDELFQPTAEVTVCQSRLLWR